MDASKFFLLHHFERLRRFDLFEGWKVRERVEIEELEKGLRRPIDNRTPRDISSTHDPDEALLEKGSKDPP